MRVGHIAGVVIAGSVWFIIGCLLTFKGLFLTVTSMISFQKGGHPLMDWLYQFFHHVEKSATCLVFVAVFLGMLKGRFVLAKTVKKFVARILLIPSPLSFKDLFPGRYVILIASMMSLGMLLKVLPITDDVRAFIDLGVGSALINGAFLYFKRASMLKIEHLRKKK